MTIMSAIDAGKIGERGLISPPAYCPLMVKPLKPPSYLAATSTGRQIAPPSVMQTEPCMNASKTAADVLVALLIRAPNTGPAEPAEEYVAVLLSVTESTPGMI